MRLLFLFLFLSSGVFAQDYSIKGYKIGDSLPDGYQHSKKKLY